MQNKKLHENYRNYIFRKDKLQDCLGIHIDTNENVPEFYAPFLPRIMISSWEAAGLIARNDPDPNTDDELVKNYRKTILEAVKNNTLNAENVTLYHGGDICSADLYKNEVGMWAKKHGCNWIFPINEDIENINQNDSQLLQKINQLEQELEEQKKNNSESVYISPLNIADISNLEAENNQLKIDNKKLTEQLNQAKKEIEELEKQVPILLGKYRNDDPLLLAIQVRNKEWAKYDHSTGKGKASQVGIIAELKEKYKISKNKASAIELVSSPIDRG